MEIIKPNIEGLLVIKPDVYFDERGYFFENYNQNDFKKLGIDKIFVQDNESKSSKGVLRGLHFQIEHPQAKLVRCIKGKVWDVAIDLRIGSPTFGKYYGVELTEDNYTMFYVPENFAHGFLVLSDEAKFSYKVSDFYHPNDEGGIIYNDKDINIKWPIPSDKDFHIILSEKDKVHQTFQEYKKWKNI